MFYYSDLKYYKIHSDSQDLAFATEGSACFDVSAYLRYDDNSKNVVKGYDSTNMKIEAKIYPGKDNKEDGRIKINPGDRILIPTGIILDIPIGYSVRTHPRSGTGYKIGLSHPHGQGIIDFDYYDELFLLFINNTQAVLEISHGQRLAQAEMVQKPIYNICETTIKPTQKTDRIGGLGSTGE